MPIQETAIRTLAAVPVNLADDVIDDVSVSSCWYFVQNTGESEIRFRETTAAPALMDKGHRLGVGDGAVVLVLRSQPFWLWSPTGTGELTISPGAAAPVRDA